MSDPYRTRYLKLRSVLYDRNTGLPAFPLLFDQLRTALDDRRVLGVLHVELQNLEMVESLYGWQVLDRIVACTAAELRDAVGDALPAGAVVGLNGVAGDRLVVFVTTGADGSEVDVVWLGRVADTLRRRLDRIFDAPEFVGLNPRIRARVGHALLADNPFQRFERCVYAAVEEARDSPERRARRREMSWSEDLERIIQSAAVTTVFQPIFEVGGLEVLGYEAYVRGPADSILESPRALFALSDRAGVAADLDRVCCERAVVRFAREVGVGRLFVNVLPASFAPDDDRAAERLHASVSEAGLAPHDLVLEFSERGVLGDPEPLCARLERLRRQGFGIALDDVGTGAVGMAALERARPDFLKLDISLVRGIDGNLIQQELLQTLARLASRIGAAVIAEGVETPAEAEAVAACGANYVQGFLYARPAPSRFEGDRSPHAARGRPRERVRGA